MMADVLTKSLSYETFARHSSYLKGVIFPELENLLSVPRSGAERLFYSRRGRHRRAAHWAVLSGLAETRKETHIKKSKSHKRKEKDTNHVRHPTKDSARGAQCAARRSPTEKRRYRGPGQHARAAARTTLRAEVQMASAAPSEPADGEFIKQCSFSKGEWADEYIQWMWVSATFTSSSRRPVTWASTR